MADKLIFPIGFDLDKGVGDAVDDWKNRVSKKLEREIAKTPVGVKLTISDAQLRGLQERFDRIKINPLTADAKASIRDMATELRGLAKALEAVSKVSGARTAVSPDAVRAARIAATTRKSDDAHEESLIRQRKLIAQAEAAEIRRAKAADGTTRHYKSQTTYLERLIKRMAIYTSLGAIGGFLTKVREVTAEFELQKVSLGAIIQDQAKANALFSEIKSFALKSPISIMDLTKYTKQVAAYRIETDKLFDTTKRLADVSVGLGVDMGRIVLAFGQVKAASYLRAAEIRQFTEAGIPMLELLAEKFSQLNGEAVTTEKVMDMVSKRMVSFDMVEQIFNDMTSAGGMFFEMQEKQGNTLYGMWAKLGDAASVMYDEIGNTSFVNSGMKSTIQLLTDMMRGWRSLAREILGGVAAFTIYKLFVQKLTVDEARLTAATVTATAAQERHSLALMSGGRWLRFTTKMAAAAAAANAKAAAATNLFMRSMYKLKAAMLGNWMTIILVAIGLIIEKLYTAYEEAHRLENAINDIKIESGIEQTKSVRNFEYLADAAVNAADGSKKQKDALDELQRTYKDIIPIEQLSIENLRRMDGNYQSLTRSIRQYVQEQMRRKAADEIISQTGTIIIEKQKKIGNELAAGYKNLGRTIPALKDTEISRFWEEYERLVKNGVTDIKELISKSFKYATGKEASEGIVKLIESMGSINGPVKWTKSHIEELTDALIKQNTELNRLPKSFSSAGDEMGHYLETLEKIKNTVSKATFNFVNKKGENVGAVDRSSFLGQQMKINLEIKKMGEEIQSEFEKLGLTWDKSMSNIVDKINVKRPEIVSALDFGKIIAEAKKSGNIEFIKFVESLQERYNELIPQDVVVQTVRKRLQDIVRAAGQTYDDFVKYQMGASETLEDYRKKLKENIEDLKNQVKGYLYALKQVLAGEAVYAGQLGWGMTAEQIKARADELQAAATSLEALYNELPSFDKDKGRKDDPRLKNAQEAVNILEKLYSRYLELRKTMSHEDATAYINKYYADNIKYLKKYGVAFDGTVEGQIKGLQKMRKTIAALPKSTKAAAEVDLKIGDTSFKNFTENLKKRLEEISAEVSKSKEAKEFFDNIFSQTKDATLAMNLTVSVFGEGGDELQRKIAQQIESVLKGGIDESGNVWGIEIPTEGIIDPNTFEVNYGILRNVIKKMGKTIPEEQKKMLDDIVKNGEKFGKDQATQWAKDLSKAKTYVEEYIDVFQTIATRQREIRAQLAKDLALIDKQFQEGTITGTEAASKKSAAESAAKGMIAGYDEKWAREQQRLQYEAFKNTPLYTSMFENLENASVGALETMRDKLEQMKSSWRNLSPTQLKELQSRLNEIDNQLAKKNPFKTIAEGWRTIREMREKHTSRANLDNEIKSQQANIESIQKQLDGTLKQQKDLKERMSVISPESAEYKMLSKEYETATQDVAKLSVALQDAQTEQNESVSDAEKWANAIKNLKEGLRGAIKIGRKMMEISEATADLMEALGESEDAVEMFREINNVISSTFDLTMELINAIDIMTDTTVASIKSVESASAILAIISAALKIATAIVNVVTGEKVRRANKIIEKQKALLDNLEHQYSRLEKAAEKAFGSQFVYNYNKQIKVLQAQVRAYEAQLAAEQSKGKKKSEDSIREYQNSIRDTQDAIEDLKGTISEQMYGSDLASAARDFASAWLDAYKEFSSTTDSIKEKFQEMMKNLVVESVMAHVMEMALKPVYDMIDDMEATDFYNQAFWSRIVAEMNKSTDNMEAGANTLMRFLEQSGISLSDATSGLTGISREIASASEESINGLAAGINTQNFYISQIHASVQGIYTLMQGGTQQAQDSVLTDLITMQNQHLAQLPSIAQNTADTVARLETLYALFNRVIKPKGQDPQFVLYTN